jgi:phosphatidylinositol-3-phosphatase
VLLNSKWITAGSVNETPYNHYSALRAYEDLLGITTGGSDGKGHLGFAGQAGLRPFGSDVFNARPITN